MNDTIKLDLSDLEPAQVAELLAFVKELRETTLVLIHAEDDESWRDAVSTGWTHQHVTLLVANLIARGKRVQREAFDRAVENGGFVSRDEVYVIGGYSKDRKLNNWTAPLNNFRQELVSDHGLPEDAVLPILTTYGDGTGYSPAIGFTVAPEIVKLLRS